ncbi:hypothetical protein [Marinivivus vitaminiproducens]|uniref:hypothetical protein n=1 Tax=Marinivivus vitaminiproducens TaxID=3035935 RepID=UPI0027AA6B4E|nr:hypothetical protein P4R82_02605 [Geminicoccaceae bacterium SCSIO 64248]
MDALEQVTVFMTLMRQLALVMDEERRHLNDLRLDTLADIQADKAALSEAYEIEIRRLRDRPEVLSSLGQPVRAELHATMQAFQRALTANIDGLIDARDRIVEARAAIDTSLHRAVGPAGIETRSLRAPARAPDDGKVITVAFGQRRQGFSA